MRHRIRAALRTTLFALAAVALASTASAATYRWSFDSADGSNGGLVAGSFDFDGSTYSGWDIVTSQSSLRPAAQGSVAYTDASSSLESFSGGLRLTHRMQLPTFAGGLVPASVLTLHFAPLREDGNVSHGYLEEVFNSAQGQEAYRSGNFTLTGVGLAAPVPEPETAVMTLVGLAMVGAAMARRRRQAHPA